MKFVKLFSCLALAAGLVFSAGCKASNDKLSADQVKQVQTIVHDYLVKNPQVLVEASQALQQQEMAKMQQNAAVAIRQNAQAIFGDNTNPILGNAKGDVTLVEFFDYQCPHCKEVAPAVLSLINKNSNLRVVFKELPIFGGNSRYAATAALASLKQGADKYLKFHDELMAAANPLSDAKVLQIAKAAGLDVDQLKKDMDSKAIDQQIDANFKLAQSLGVMGTPTFIIAKWNVGGDNKNVNAAFVPGQTTEANLQQLIKQAK